MREAGLVMVRHADDSVVLCRSREEAESALARMRAWVNANGLTLHPDKTHLGDCRVEGHGFEFLGYRIERRLKTLRSLTPYEHICKTWADEPDRFRYDPTRLTSGLNT
jgi:RNA-directed DNA polymerase